MLAAWLAVVAPAAAAPHEFTVTLPGGEAVHVLADGDGAPALEPALRRWVSRSARALTTYAGRFPVDTLFLSVQVGGGAGVHGGRAFPTDPSTINVMVGAGTGAAQFDDDWVLVHEMAHLMVPDLPRRHAWFEEGFAGYVEAMARAAAGHRPARDTWRHLYDGIGQGAPGPADGGLDGTRRWGRLYWASVWFFLRADVALRSRAGRGLPDVIAAWQARRLDLRRAASLATLLASADTVAGWPLFSELYDEIGVQRGRWQPELEWRALGLLDTDGSFAWPGDGRPAVLRARLTAPFR